MSVILFSFIYFNLLLGLEDKGSRPFATQFSFVRSPHPVLFKMPILDLQDPVTYQLLNVPSEQDDQELLENGVFWLLSLRRGVTGKGGDITQRTLQTSKALKGIQSDSARTSPKVDLGVQTTQDLNKKRKRATREEVAILRRAFSVNPLPPLEVRSKIAQQLNWTPRKVKIWFQNERAKLRKRSRDCESPNKTDSSQDENSMQDEGTKSPTTTPVHYPSASSSTSIPPATTEKNLLTEPTSLPPQLSQSVLSTVKYPFPFHTAMTPFRQWATVGGDQ